MVGEPNDGYGYRGGDASADHSDGVPSSSSSPRSYTSYTPDDYHGSVDHKVGVQYRLYCTVRVGPWGLGGALPSSE